MLLSVFTYFFDEDWKLLPTQNRVNHGLLEVCFGGNRS